MQFAEAFEPEQQVAEFVLPAKHTLNGVEPFLEDRRVEKWLAAAFDGLLVSGIGVAARFVQNCTPSQVAGPDAA